MQIIISLSLITFFVLSLFYVQTIPIFGTFGKDYYDSNPKLYKLICIESETTNYVKIESTKQTEEECLRVVDGYLSQGYQLQSNTELEASSFRDPTEQWVLTR